MSTSVGDLVAGIHALAWEYTRPDAATEMVARPEAVIAAWPHVAAGFVRAVGAVPLADAWSPELDAVHAGLRAVARSARATDLDDVGGHPVLGGVALRLGAIADLLAGMPAAETVADRQAARGLRANLLVAAHVLATATVTGLQARGGVFGLRQSLEQVARATEIFTLIPEPARRGRYDDVAAIGVGEQSLDALAAAWASSCVTACGSQHGVSGLGLQTVGVGVLAVTAAAAVATRASWRLGLVDTGAARVAVAGLEAAYEAWSEPARWPAWVRLDGERPDTLTDTTAQLRASLEGVFREGRGWASPQQIAARIDPETLMGVTRRSMHAAERAAGAYQAAVRNAIVGTGQAWIAARVITNPVYRGEAVRVAAQQKGWVMLPRGEEHGRALLTAANRALEATCQACRALDVTASPGASPEGEALNGLRLSRGRLVTSIDTSPAPQPWETLTPSRSSGPARPAPPTVGGRRRPPLGPSR